jgi:hypothetical protein
LVQQTSRPQSVQSWPIWAFLRPAATALMPMSGSSTPQRDLKNGRNTDTTTSFDHAEDPALGQVRPVFAEQRVKAHDRGLTDV